MPTLYFSDICTGGVLGDLIFQMATEMTDMAPDSRRQLLSDSQAIAGHEESESEGFGEYYSTSTYYSTQYLLQYTVPTTVHSTYYSTPTYYSTLPTTVLYLKQYVFVCIYVFTANNHFCLPLCV